MRSGWSPTGTTPEIRRLDGYGCRQKHLASLEPGQVFEMFLVRYCQGSSVALARDRRLEKRRVVVGG